jgi:hypothetical protein
MSKLSNNFKIFIYICVFGAIYGYTGEKLEVWEYVPEEWVVNFYQEKNKETYSTKVSSEQQVQELKWKSKYDMLILCDVKLHTVKYVDPYYGLKFESSEHLLGHSRNDMFWQSVLVGLASTFVLLFVYFNFLPASFRLTENTDTSNESKSSK